MRAALTASTLRRDGVLASGSGVFRLDLAASRAATAQRRRRASAARRGIMIRMAGSCRGLVGRGPGDGPGPSPGAAVAAAPACDAPAGALGAAQG